MAEDTTVVRVYDPYAETSATIKEFQRSGFDMNNLSIVGKDYHTETHGMGYRNAGDLKKVWCELGNFWGGLSGLLFGSCFIVIPGIGRVIVFGPLVSWIARALRAAVRVGELSVLGAGLYSIGVPKNSVTQFETALKSNKFLLIAHGRPDEMVKVKIIAETSSAAQVIAYGGRTADVSHRLLGITPKTFASGG